MVVPEICVLTCATIEDRWGVVPRHNMLLRLPLLIRCSYRFGHNVLASDSEVNVAFRDISNNAKATAIARLGVLSRKMLWEKACLRSLEHQRRTIESNCYHENESKRRTKVLKVERNVVTGQSSAMA